MLHTLLCFFILMSSPCTQEYAITGNSKVNTVLGTAKKLLKSKYKAGGKNPSGFDCSGFTQYVYKKALGIRLGASSKLQSQQGMSVTISDVKKGDLIFFEVNGRINHVGIIYDVSKSSLWIIHATSSKGVILEDIKKSPYWRSKISKIRRFF